MNVLVTGGAGFIGSNFMKFWVQKHPEDHILCMDCLTYAANLENLREIWDKIAFYKGSICYESEIARAFQLAAPEVVVNFAAETHVDRSIENPALFQHTNSQGTANLLEACRKYGVIRFHQVSTDEVYGDLPLGPSVSGWTEDAPLRPSSPYSATKASADLLTLAYHRTYGLPVTISRCCNNYGPNQNEEKLIPKLIHMVETGQPLPLYGNGQNVREWLHVEDHCRAIEAILLHGQDGRIYNVGGEACTNLTIAQYICTLLKEYSPSITFVEDRPGHDLRYCLDDAQIRSELGWKRTISLEEGLKKLVAELIAPCE